MVNLRTNHGALPQSSGSQRNEATSTIVFGFGINLGFFFFFDFFVVFSVWGASLLLLLLLLLLLGRGVAVRGVIFKNKKAAPSPPDALGVVAFVRAAFLVLFFSFYS